MTQTQIESDIYEIYRRLIRAIKESDSIDNALPLIDRVLSIARILTRHSGKKKASIDELVETLSE